MLSSSGMRSWTSHRRLQKTQHVPLHLDIHASVEFNMSSLCEATFSSLQVLQTFTCCVASSIS